MVPSSEVSRFLFPVPFIVAALSSSSHLDQSCILVLHTPPQQFSPPYSLSPWCHFSPIFSLPCSLPFGSAPLASAHPRWTQNRIAPIRWSVDMRLKTYSGGWHSKLTSWCHKVNVAFPERIAPIPSPYTYVYVTRVDVIYKDSFYFFLSTPCKIIQRCAFYITRL